MELTVKNIKGSDTKKKVNLSDSIFGIEPNDHAIYLDVKQYLANQRQGTSKAKERAEVTGSTKKIKKQKGTGTARAGSIKSPVFKGGGTIFGPRPRNYSFKLNKKLKALARKSALSYKAKNGGLSIIEDFTFDAPKTKEFKSILENLKVNDKKSLIVLSDLNKNIYLSSRNLKNTKVVTASGLSTYDLMNASNILLSEGSLESIQTLLS
ncbi:50S ribosomal protein L4 [Acidiluteibacter ferrifornacis]|jgi:large subunit ribosomal protein L4|uniref:Large ribosomal subunit protein uL4 n=1 Tax=Acidiluteibacter ferrifornacis TaxID=2692424 RepID=A0A6N9NGS5_9FLAO|nr:50S ribosomal protein L4 [Acidiluteibacter ferrifornacis]NBG65848.1 50S ribosomal protein L4 [Acidiluteibacter ferrifornacis]